jgi:hypothetical protein
MDEELSCWEAFIEHESELVHECDRDKGHKGDHKCYCGMEW